MSSTVVADSTDSRKSEKTLIIIVNNDGTVCVDQESLQGLLANQQNTTVSVVRFGNQSDDNSQDSTGTCDSQNDGNPHVNLTVEGIYPPPMAGTSSQEGGGAGLDPILEMMDQEQLQRLETALQSEQAKQILGEGVTAMLGGHGASGDLDKKLEEFLYGNFLSPDGEMLNAEEQAAIADTIRLDHCYTSLEPGYLPIDFPSVPSDAETSDGDSGRSNDGSRRGDSRKDKSSPMRRSQRQMDRLEREEVARIRAENEEMIRQEKIMLESSGSEGKGEEPSPEKPSLEKPDQPKPSMEKPNQPKGRGRGRPRKDGMPPSSKGRGRGKSNGSAGEVSSSTSSSASSSPAAVSSSTDRLISALAPPASIAATATLVPVIKPLVLPTSQTTLVLPSEPKTIVAGASKPLVTSTTAGVELKSAVLEPGPSVSLDSVQGKVKVLTLQSKTVLVRAGAATDVLASAHQSLLDSESPAKTSLVSSSVTIPVSTVQLRTVGDASATPAQVKTVPKALSILDRRQSAQAGKNKVNQTAEPSVSNKPEVSSSKEKSIKNSQNEGVPLHGPVNAARSPIKTLEAREDSQESEIEDMVTEVVVQRPRVPRRRGMGRGKGGLGRGRGQIGRGAGGARIGNRGCKVDMNRRGVVRRRNLNKQGNKGVSLVGESSVADASTDEASEVNEQGSVGVKSVSQTAGDTAVGRRPSQNEATAKLPAVDQNEGQVPKMQTSPDAGPRKLYPKRENRKPPAHLADAFGPALFSTPDVLRRVDEKSPNEKEPVSPGKASASPSKDAETVSDVKSDEDTEHLEECAVTMDEEPVETPDSNLSEEKSTKQNASARSRVKSESIHSDEDESDDSEDDPNRLWCICKKPHNNRFMICCDRCEDWFHGKCVGITKAMGRAMEENGEEWLCPPCATKKEDEEAKPKVENEAVKGEEELVKKDQEEKEPEMKNQTVSEVGKGHEYHIPKTQKAGPSQNPRPSVSVMYCIVCKKESRPTSIYCSDACILKHAQESLNLLSKEKEKSTGKAPKASEGKQELKKDGIEGKTQQLDSRVIVFERNTGSLLTGPNAPTMANLQTWLKAHPTFEVLRPGVQPTSKFYGSRVPTKAAVKAIYKQNLSPMKNPPPVPGKPVIRMPTPQKTNSAPKSPNKAKAILNLNTALGAKPTAKTSLSEALVAKPPSIQDSSASKTTTATPSSTESPAGASSSIPVIKPVISSTSSSGPAGKPLTVVLQPGSTLDTGTTTVRTIKLPVATSQETNQRYVTYKIIPTVKMSVPPPKSPTTTGTKTSARMTTQSPPPVSKVSVPPIKVPATSTVKDTTSPSVKSPQAVSKKLEVKKVELKKAEKVEVRKDSVDGKKVEKVETKKLVEVKKVEHKKEPEQQPKKPSDPEPIRLNVKKTLQEVLLARCQECEDIKVSEDEMKKIAVDIEEELYSYFKDTGAKYKSKYRSLMFNIKDPKNKALFRKIVQADVSPYQLVRMSPDELASQELAEWRERETKHQLEMIQKNELDMLQKGITYVMKTHKGEQIIEKDDSLKLMESRQEQPKLEAEVLALQLSTNSVSSTVEDKTLEHPTHGFDSSCELCTGRRTSSDIKIDVTEKYSIKEKIDKSEKDKEKSKEKIASREKTKKDKHKSRKEEKHDRENKSHHRHEEESKEAHRKKKQVPQEKKKEKEKINERRKSRHRSDSDSHKSEGEKSKSKKGDKQDVSTTKKSEPTSESAESKVSDSDEHSTKSLKYKLSKKYKPKDLKGEPVKHDILEKYKPTEIKKDKKEKYKPLPVKGEHLKDASNSPTYKPTELKADTLKEKTKVDVVEKPVEQNLQKEDNDLSDNEPTSTVIINTPDINSDELDKEEAATVWKGFVNMVDIAKFNTLAYEVSGVASDLANDLPKSLDVVGRISPEVVWDYISKMKKSGTKEILVIRFMPANDEEKIPYLSLYSYLSSRGRFGVVGNASKFIKDLYVLPLASHSPVPQILLPLDGPGFEDYRPHLLLGIVVRSRRKTTEIYQPRPTEVSRAKKNVKAETVVPPDRSYTPPLPSEDDAAAIPIVPDSQSFTPPHPPPPDDEGSYTPPLMDTVSEPLVSSLEAAQGKRKRHPKASNKNARKMRLSEDLTSGSNSLDGDSPYSPGDSVIDESTADLQKEVEELDRKIEEERQQLESLKAKTGSGTSSLKSSVANVNSVPSDENEAYSPSGSFTPPQDEDGSGINLPQNLQEMLAKIRKQDDKTLNLKCDPIVQNYGGEVAEPEVQEEVKEKAVVEKISNPTASMSKVGIKDPRQRDPRRAPDQKGLSNLSDSELIAKAAEMENMEQVDMVVGCDTPPTPPFNAQYPPPQIDCSQPPPPVQHKTNISMEQPPPPGLEPEGYQVTQYPSYPAEDVTQGTESQNVTKYPSYPAEEPSYPPPYPPYPPPEVAAAKPPVPPLPSGSAMPPPIAMVPPAGYHAAIVPTPYGPPPIPAPYAMGAPYPAPAAPMPMTVQPPPPPFVNYNFDPRTRSYDTRQDERGSYKRKYHDDEGPRDDSYRLRSRPDSGWQSRKNSDRRFWNKDHSDSGSSSGNRGFKGRPNRGYYRGGRSYHDREKWDDRRQWNRDEGSQDKKSYYAGDKRRSSSYEENRDA